ncbi:MAG: divalent-cation tolerance protein CutA [Methanobacteriota archaeon]|nr:MAG: divalent-cation tolerance protein CutA [Euryarchaeota archaeon]
MAGKENKEKSRGSSLECCVAVVMTTFSREEDAENVATLLLSKSLASCIQMSNIKSLYKWKGRLEKGKEVLCIIKCLKDNIEGVVEEIKKNHTYEVPEIIVLEGRASKEYVDWMRRNDKKDKEGGGLVEARFIN